MVIQLYNKILIYLILYICYIFFLRTEIDAVRQLEVRLVNDSTVEPTTSKSVGPAVPVEPAEPVEPDEPNEPFEPFELSDENDDDLAKTIRPGKKRKREEIDRAKPGTSKSENEREALMKKHRKKSKKDKKRDKKMSISKANQLLYMKYMTKTMPKLLKVLGVSSSSSAESSSDS